ncbi:MAG TPA: glycoside hydrolase family 97 catalytic domain-containing protein [Candidatus Eisenbergiella merdavium]|uniref:Glycoside hydrolase family 97 catalytic domain-containing protein n=1 Tax=Candidatus Eisenbergiella merdavium TaxID=2838551 RepID=A0A9D2SPQ3_9FIRM|nr:glycoside hydrolase family 97 catalytic domain-containing protein [Candidatus Eisenbergiella merdavium]
MWILASPDGQLTVTVDQKKDGLYYKVLRGGKKAIDESRLGICTDLGDFSDGLVFETQERNSVREEYSLPAGKKEIYINHAEELALRFCKNESEFIVRLRAFDDGMAFRYEICRSGRECLLVKKEETEFQIGTDRLMWLQDWVPTYEGAYNARSWDKSMNGQPFGMPSLFHDEQDGIWIMLNEANVINTNGSYCSCHLVGDERGYMRIGFAPEEKGNPISSPLPFHSPWRYAVVAESLDELVNSTVNYNLNPSSGITDTSWIHPGRALWSWWEDMNGAQLYLESRDYVDMAAAYGFEGVTLDCGWDASWVKELCKYAHKKNVQIWIWTPMQKLDTREKAEKLIPLWASWGVDGLKIDFFENDSQHTMQQYNLMADLMIRHKLMINFHGSVKPMGEGRTWPNFMTAEGIMGMEHYQWSDLPDSVHNCTVPFTRNVAGPMDYTPTAFSNRKNRNTTMGHQLALPVVFDSGLTNYALALRYMEGWRGTDFLRRTKAHYQGVKVLSGYPGDHAAILRYTDEEWLIGVITSPKKVVRLPLSFLGEGEYDAEIYEDCAKGEMVAVTKKKVTASDSLELSLLADGGAGIYITRKAEPLRDGVCSGYMSCCFTEYPGEDALLLHGSEKVQWEDGTCGFVLNGAAAFRGSVKETKNYTLRLFYAAEEPWELELVCGSFAGRWKMQDSSGIRTFVTRDILLPITKGAFSIELRRISGQVPGIWKLKLIDNEPFMPISVSVCQENLRRGGEIVSVNGVPTAVGLGGKAELVFDKITVPETGKYILRIVYTAGENRDVSIQVNDIDTIHTYLHNSSGWAFPSWRNEDRKEILVKLEKGENRIRLYHDNGPMSHIRGIEVVLVK